MNPSLVCVYSLPRSGSTVLIAELDRLKGVICLPESYFPQVLELLSPEELASPDTLAAFYLASSPSGSLLSFDETRACMMPGDWNSTLVNLGLACAGKTKRDPAEVKVIIWKTTRIIGRWQLFHAAGGRFMVLRRNPVNVFESQFRVDFGRHNRNPVRFGAFLESYEAVFSRIPLSTTFIVEYEKIPEQLASIQGWLGVGKEHWPEGESSLEKTHAKHSWHGGLLDGFQSKDHMKRENVTAMQQFAIRSGRTITRPFHPVMRLLRDHYDRGIMQQVRGEALDILSGQDA